VDDVIPLAVRSVFLDNSSSVKPDDITPGFNISQNDSDISVDSSQEALASFLCRDVQELSDNEIPIDSENPTATVSWLESYDSQTLRDKQLADSDLCQVITWLENKVSPKKDELYLCSPAVKALWLCKKQLVLKSGVLYYHWEGPEQTKLRLVVPLALKEEVLFLCHDAKPSGHLGQTKTLSRLKKSFLWHNMGQDCKVYVSSCKTCNENKKQNVHNRAALQP
jgi:hypothetical protein